MTVINTNTSANITANALTKNERVMSQAMQRLSTGQRINSAGDDAAGLAISSRMTSQINGLNMAVRNANDAISMIQTADGAYNQVLNILQRMRELAVQSASGTNIANAVTKGYNGDDHTVSDDRIALNTEYQALSDQIHNIGANTQWNSSTLLNDTIGTTGLVDFQVGANSSQTIQVDFGSLSSQATATIDSNYADGESGSTDAIATVSITGTLKAGDVISFFVENRPVTWTLDSTDITTLSGSNTTTVQTANYTFGTIAQGYNRDYNQTTLTDPTVLGELGFALAGTATANQFTMVTTGSSNGDSFSVENVRVGRGITTDIARTGIKSDEQANAAILALDLAISSTTSQMANFGSALNRLEYAADNLTNVSQNVSASRSRILDADYASETTELAKTQIIQQAATAMLSQANQYSQSVLSLLK